MTTDYTPIIKALSLKQLIRLVNNHRRDPEQLLSILMKDNPANLSREKMRATMFHLAQLGEVDLKTRQRTRSLSGRL